MATRRKTFLAVVAVLACVLVPAGAALVATGVAGHHDGRTVLGIVLGVLGLACVRVLTWARRIGVMTQVGLSFHVDERADDEAGGGKDHPCGSGHDGGSA